MTSPDTLRGDLVGALKDVTALVTALGGDEDNIIEYVEEESGDLTAAIAQLKPPAVLVAYQGAQVTRQQSSLWQQNFSIFCRLTGSPSVVFMAIWELRDTEFTGYHSMEPPTLQRRSLLVAENLAFDYWEIQTGFLAKGL